MTRYTLWTDLRLAPNADPERVIEDACLVEQAGRIAWMGPSPEGCESVMR